MGNWLVREGQKWVEAGIITEAQLQQILARYPQKSWFTNLLPFFASLLIGLGIISWIAANWDGIDRWVRLGIVLVFVVAFYGLGDWFKRRGNEPTAIGMMGLGVISFGAGLILTAQTFQLGSESSAPFALWSLAALSMAWINRSTVLYLLAWGISFSGITGDFANPFWYYLAIAIYLFGFFAFPRFVGKRWLLWFWSVGSIAYAFKFLSMLQADNIWLVIWWLVLYTLYAYEKEDESRTAPRTIAVYAMFINGLIISVSASGYSFWYAYGTQQILFISSTILLLAASGWLLFRRKENISLTDGLVLIPWFIMIPARESNFDVWQDERFWSLLPLIPYALHGLLSMWRGSAERRQSLAVLGMLQFLAVALSVFAIPDWNFNVKFLIFVISGLILFVVNTLIRRWTEKRSKLALSESEAESEGGQPE